MLRAVFLAGPARTAIGSFCGALCGVPAPRLASIAIREAVRRAAVPAAQVDEAIFGNVLSAGLGQNVARQAALCIGGGESVALAVQRC